ncbi:MAG: RIP metalloprotease RseP [Piscirickettsiaceae bacterium]|nr:RIP metalloprotease RseP [Piscirickettsiaceae bacterium]
MQSLLYLLVTLAILITVHEFGHFWVARRCGVKVLKFSIGFGKPLWKRRGKDGTEYILAAIPLGGYVKMLDEREGDVEPQDLDQAFNRKPLRSRVAIVAAGPIANLIFAVIAYWFIFVIGVAGIRPIIGDVAPNSNAEIAQLVAGNEIKAVNGTDTPTWFSVHKLLLKSAEEGEVVDLSIDLGGITLQRQLEIPKQDNTQSPPISLFQTIGITPLRVELKPVLAFIAKDSAAERAGLQAGDLLVSADGESISNWSAWVALIQASPDKEIQIKIDRLGLQFDLRITPSKSANNTGVIGVRVDSSQTTIPEELQAELRYGPIEALGKAVQETWSFSLSTLKNLAGMISGSVSTKNLGGPITIAKFASASADSGLISFISFLAMISVSLAILNFLPIPILDGGHLALYFIEWLRGKPVSEQVQLQGQKVGLILLLMLMFLAFFNDLSRVFG